MDIDNRCDPCGAMVAFQFGLTISVVFVHPLDATTQTEMVPMERGTNKSFFYKEIQRNWLVDARVCVRIEPGPRES